MPRGVYDRSLTKEQRAAMKSAKEKKATKGAAPQKRKYTRRAVAATPVVSSKKMSGPDGSFVLMNEIRNNLATLAQVRNVFGDIPSLASEAEAQVSALGVIRDKLFREEDIQDHSVSEDGSDEDEPPSNGVIQNQAAPVPLPPPPPVAPVLPTPH